MPTVFVFEIGSREALATGIFDIDWDGEHIAGIGKVEWIEENAFLLHVNRQDGVFARVLLDSSNLDGVGEPAWDGQVRRKLTGTIIGWSEDEPGTANASPSHQRTPEASNERFPF